MGPGAIVVPDIFFEDSPEVVLVQDNQVVQTLPTNGADQSLDIRILPWRLGCGENFSQPHGLGSSTEVGAVDAISVMEQILRLIPVSWERFAKLLHGPLSGRMVGDIKMKDAPAIMTEDCETEQKAEGSTRSHKEVTSGSLTHVVLEERPPTLRGRPWRSSGHVLRHRGFG